MKSKSINGVVEYAKKHGLKPSSRVLNITHYDLDGAVAAINLKNYLNDTGNFFFLLKTYTNINQFFKEIYFKEKCIFKNVDFIIVTDICIDEDVIEEFENRDETLIVLDHHETARPLNKYDNCFIDETEKESGASVTLNFIKEMGFKRTHLDKLNRIATEWDLFIFKDNPELRKFEIHGKKRALAELMNSLFFSTRPSESFVDRWAGGWEKGFTRREMDLIKTEFKIAQDAVSSIDGSNRKIQLDENKVLLLDCMHLGEAGDVYLDEKKNKILMAFNPKKSKFSVRSSDDGTYNIGKMLKVMQEKFDYVETGGGHVKAGGGNLISNDHLDDFVEKFMKLCSYYE